MLFMRYNVLLDSRGCGNHNVLYTRICHFHVNARCIGEASSRHAAHWPEAAHLRPRGKLRASICFWDYPSRTPPVETATSRNKNARNISQNLRGIPHESTNYADFCKFPSNSATNRTMFAQFGGNLQSSAQFVGISANIR